MTRLRLHQDAKGGCHARLPVTSSDSPISVSLARMEKRTCGDAVRHRNTSWLRYGCDLEWHHPKQFWFQINLHSEWFSMARWHCNKGLGKSWEKHGAFEFSRFSPVVPPWKVLQSMWSGNSELFVECFVFGKKREIHSTEIFKQINTLSLGNTPRIPFAFMGLHGLFQRFITGCWWPIWIFVAFPTKVTKVTKDQRYWEETPTNHLFRV